MSTALLPGGLYRTKAGEYVDANGNAVTKKEAEKAAAEAEKADTPKTPAKG